MKDLDVETEEKLRSLAAYSGDPWEATNPYFIRAEEYAADLWKNLIYPFIHDCDFDVVIDLAAGHGRNSAFLLPKARSLFITDYVSENVKICEKRFAGNKTVHCFVGNGYNFKPLDDDCITLIYCFDAMVHFDSDVIRSYLRDSKRILKGGGRAFLHHSNYTGGHDWRTNPNARNFMSMEMFRHYALKEGLSVLRQKIINWGSVENSDCLSLLEKVA